MARTFRTIPAWVATIPEGDSHRASKNFQRASQGRDGAIRSEIAQSAKNGKRDDWSTAPKGRANKRIAGKQIRAFVKAETAKEVADSDAFSLDEYRAAAKENEEFDRLARALEWAEEDAGYAARDLSHYLARVAEIRQEIAEVKGA